MIRKKKKQASRILSLSLAAAMTMGMLGNMTLPAFAEEDTASVIPKVSITSDYLRANYNDSLGGEAEEAAVFSLFSDRTETQSVSGNDAESTAIREPVCLKDGYDENGLGTTYHDITLNYSLVESSVVHPGTTFDEVWADHPESFISSYMTSAEIYAIAGNNDYFIAFIDPAALNGSGKAVYADFVDGNVWEPEIYNDIITFDQETGIIYIPQSFFYNEEGVELAKPLEAQLLVPYSFDSRTDSTIQLDVENSAGIAGVREGSIAIDRESLDVTLSLPIAEPCTSLESTQMEIYLNDAADPMETDDEHTLFYDAENGVLTISAAPVTLYSVSVKVLENRNAGIMLLADEDTYHHVSSAAEMKTLPGVTIAQSGLKAGQLYTYEATYTYYNVDSKNPTSTAIINTTYPYCYTYVTSEELLYNQVKNGATVTIKDLVSRQNLTEGSAAFNLFNMMTELPDRSTTTDPTYTSSDGKGKTTWTVDLRTMNGYPGTVFNQVATHCSHVSAPIGTPVNGEGTYTGTLYVRCLYVDPAGTYAVFGFITPAINSQSGTGVYKVKIIEDALQKVYSAKLGLKKVSSENTSVGVSGAVYAIGETADEVNTAYDRVQASNITSAASASNLVNAATTASVITTTSGTVYSKTYVWDDAEGTKRKTMYIREVFAPEGYELDTSIYTVVMVGAADREDGIGSSILSANTSNTGTHPIKFTNGSNYGVITVQDIPEEPDNYYAKLGFDKYEYNPDNTAGSRLSGAVIGIAGSEAQAQAGALMGGTSYASKTLTTSSSAAVYYNWTLGQGVTIKTLYAYEASAPNGYDRNDGYWKIVLQGTTDTSGAGTQIISATYYDYSSSTKKWGSYTLSTATHYNYNRGWYTQGSDSVIPVIHVTDRKLITYSVEKLFANDGTKAAVTSVTAELYRNGTATGKTITLNAGNNWKYTWTGLDKYDDNGKAYTYTVKEIKVNGSSNLSGYTVTYDNSKATITTITNKLSGTVSYSVEKKFANAGTKSAVTSVTAELYQNNTATGKTVTLNAVNNWKYTWTGLDKYDGNGKAYTYTVKEIKVNGSTDLSGYTVTYDNSKASITTITNKLSGTVSYSVEKKFANAGTKSAVTSVTAELYRNGTATGKTITLNAGNNWKYTWTGLDKYDGNGKAYTYTVKEIKVNGSSNLSGYTVTYDNSKTSITSITNELAGRPELPVTGGFGTTIFYIFPTS